MRARYLAGGLLLPVFLLLTGCLSIYKVGGRTFFDMDQALRYQKTQVAEGLKDIPHFLPIDGSLMISLPPDAVILKNLAPFDEWLLYPQEREYYIEFCKNDASALKEAVLKSEMFESVMIQQGGDSARTAADFGYKFVLKYEDKSNFSLTNTTSGQAERISAVGGLRNVVVALESSLRRLDSDLRPAVRSAASRNPGYAGPVEEMEYSEATKRGWVSIRAKGLSARKELLHRIAEICATKNKLLISDDARTTGTFKVLDEELKDGVLKIYFESMY